MYELKNLERYLRVNLLGPGPRLMKKEFTGLRSHKGWKTLIYTLISPVVSTTELLTKIICLPSNSS